MPKQTRSLHLLTLALLLAVSTAPRGEDANRLTDTELADGWIQLFDGHSLFGWKSAGKVDWNVENGAITATTGDIGLLHTTTQFADYVLKLEFRAPAETNSGVFLRTPPRPGDPTRDCYELNIAPAKGSFFPTGSLVGRRRVVVEHKADAWRSLEVTARGGEITIQLDGKQIAEYRDPNPVRRGYIGLQHNQGKVAFRNIKLRPLGLNDIFNGRDLTGWRQPADQASKFTVTDEGYLQVKDGKGQLETTGTWGDFVLQLECRVNGKHLNSGIFFRCIPGDPMNGYESQIHNGYQDGDRTKPIDCGTGGFFRRQDARKVVADDFKWFHKTIIADGPHMAAWVNGYQVSDWTDTREPHENPRKGKRLKAGTIIIQGHDPTTDLLFRNLRIVELPR